MTSILETQSSTSLLLDSGLHNISFDKKILKLSLSSRAARAMADQGQDGPGQEGHIDVELELYFSCLIRKRVNIRQQPRADAIFKTAVNDFLSISFRPVMTKVCLVSDAVGEPDIEPLPIVKPERFTPNWLSLDYKNGQWQGEFGY